MKPDLDAIKEQVQIFDPGLKPDDYAFQAAVILMAAASVTGPYVERISCFTKYHPTLVAEISQRMREAGLWTDDWIEYQHWCGELGDLSFMMDVMVAEGSLMARRGEDGKWGYWIRPLQ
jgi:hypothetical protein